MNTALLFRQALITALALCSLQVSAHEYTLGNIKIAHPWARATAPGAQTGGGYLKLENKGAADRLISVSTSAAETAELHSMSMHNDVMKMQKLDKGIELPAGKTVELSPGGLHIMLMGLKAPLKAGTNVPLKLKFEKAGEIAVDIKVENMTGSTAAGSASHH